MNRFLATLFFSIIILSAAALLGQEVPKVSNLQKELKDKKETERLPEPSEISDLKFKFAEGEVILSWTVKDSDEIISFSVERITENETKILGELKAEADLVFFDWYTLKDKLSEEDLRNKIIIYRVRGLDSAGQMIRQKQIPIDTEKELSGYELTQNYPNPYNPITKIEYRIPIQQHVTLKIFNILGNLVSVLVDEMHPPGMYEAEFNGSNLTSGVYLYTVQAGNYTQTKRMILMK